MFPGTFTSLQRIEVKDDDEAGKKVLEAVKNVKLIYVGGICCAVGAGGMIWLVCYILFLYFILLLSYLCSRVFRHLLSCFRFFSSRVLTCVCS